jgi:hypothetical protein
MKLFTAARLIPTLAAFAAMAILFTPLPARAQAECKSSFDAIDKLTTTPHHTYSTTKMPSGKERTSEGSLAGGVIYVQINGTWKKSPLTPDELRQQEQENRKDAKHPSCKHERDDSVNGEPAQVQNSL